MWIYQFLQDQPPQHIYPHRSFLRCLDTILYFPSIYLLQFHKKMFVQNYFTSFILILFVGYDKELYGLTGAIHYLVENETTNIKSYKPIHHFFPVF